MRTAEIHPEELLDRERKGLLSESERRQLDLHAASCGACRMQRAAASDFEDELAPQADDDRVLARLVDGALRVDDHFQRRSRWWIRGAWLAAALLAAGGAAATVWSGARSRSLSVPAMQPIAPASAPAPQPSAVASAAADLELDFPSQDPSPIQTPVSAKNAASAEAADRGATAQDLFARANEARRQNRDAAAVSLYRELQRRFPDSREAVASRAVLGQLLLDKSDPNAALGQFDRYLAEGKNGSVNEEALAGRAMSLQRLGRTAEERAAWQELLQRFPHSLHASRARERLAQTTP
ncbi:MAG: tetratricopeptide repeat protein [Deltaproteobacteria bacterium]|nr:tetratricopeptide repeat protein [Deltaproteobacteria bacterium]